MPIKWKSKVILAKIESAYGVDPTPTGAANAMLMTGVELSPMEGEDVSRDLEFPYLAAQGMIPVGLRVRLRGKVELAPSGAAGTAPAWGPLLRACGVAETIVTDTSVTYEPITDSMESVAIHFWIGGTQHKMLGVRGDATLRFTAQGLPYIEFDLTGLYTEPAEATPATPTLTGFQTPLVVTDTNTPTFTVDDGGGAVSLVMREFQMALGNQVEPRLLVRSESIIIPDRAEAVTVHVEAVPVSTFNPYALASAQTPVEVVLVHGTDAGAVATLDLPHRPGQAPDRLREPAEHPGMAARPDPAADRRQRPVEPGADIAFVPVRPSAVLASCPGVTVHAQARAKSHLQPRRPRPGADRRRPSRGDLSGALSRAADRARRRVRFPHRGRDPRIPRRDGRSSGRDQRRKGPVAALQRRAPRPGDRPALRPPGAARRLPQGGGGRRRGKLTWAARAWVSGGLDEGAGDDDDEAVADARRWGLGEDAVDAIRGALSGNTGDGAGVWPQHVAIVTAFLACATQWRTTVAPAGDGFKLLWLGLDYAGARAGVEAAGLALDPDIWAGVRIMEAAARDALNGR